MGGRGSGEEVGGEVQSLNPGPSKFRDHRDEEKAAQRVERAVSVSEGKLRTQVRKGHPRGECVQQPKWCW